MHRLLACVVAAGLGFAGLTFGGEGKGTVVEMGQLKAPAPASWKLVDKKSPFRLYTFTLPKAKGDERDAELVVSFFGKGGGGGVKANIERWQSMFYPPKGKTIEEATKVEKKKVGDVDVTVVDIEGTFKDKFPPFAPDAKVTPRADYRRLNVVFDSDDGPFFIYAIGPAKTIGSHKKAFDDWLQNFK